MTPAKLTVTHGQCSSAGKKKVNQDYLGLFIPQDHQLNSKGIALAIADGISTSNVSQIASQTAINSFLADYYSTSETWSVKNAAQQVLQAVNSWLYAKTQQSPNRFNKEKGYITTFSALVLKSTTAHILHVGDTRIYRLANNNLEQLTVDHCHFVSENDSYITRALGIAQKLDIDYHSVVTDVGDTFILSTDGVYEYLNGADIIKAIESQPTDLNKAAEHLLTLALKNGSPDNLSIQLVSIKKLPEKNMSELQHHSSSLPLPPVLKPRMFFDGFHIIRELYISSRSHVYLATDTESDQHVVLKTPSEEMKHNKDYIERFLIEEWIAKRLNNPHIAKAYTPNRKRNYLYMCMEYIEGQDLKQWMVDNPKPSLEKVRNIVEQAAKGLQAFHRQEMIHQDIRPNNIMIDQHGTVKIIDFGATKVAGLAEILPEDNTIQGTMQYTAPEYFVGAAGLTQSDIFSLGVLSYQMLTGHLPYGTAVSKATTKVSQRKLHYQLITAKDNSIPIWVDYAIKKAVHPNPYKRYQEISEFSYDLRQPNREFVARPRPPIIDRNPIAFWQTISLVLLVIVIAQAISD